MHLLPETSLGKLWRYLFFRPIQACQGGAGCGRSIWRREESPTFNSSTTLSWRKGPVRRKWRHLRQWCYRLQGTFDRPYGCWRGLRALFLLDGQSSRRTGWSQRESKSRASRRGHLQDNKHARFRALSCMDLSVWPPCVQQCCLLAAQTLTWLEVEPGQSKGRQEYFDQDRWV